MKEKLRTEICLLLLTLALSLVVAIITFYIVAGMWARIDRGLDDAWTKPQVVLYPETVWGKEDYKDRKKEAEELGISVRELTLRRRPELRELREKLGVE